MKERPGNSGSIFHCVSWALKKETWRKSRNTTQASTTSSLRNYNSCPIQAQQVIDVTDTFRPLPDQDTGLGTEQALGETRVQQQKQWESILQNKHEQGEKAQLQQAHAETMQHIEQNTLNKHIA